MDERRVADLESRLDSMNDQLVTLGGRISHLDGVLTGLPEHQGWRHLRPEIGKLRWQYVIQPQLAKLAIVFLVAFVAGIVAAVAVRG